MAERIAATPVRYPFSFVVARDTDLHDWDDQHVYQSADVEPRAMRSGSI